MLHVKHGRYEADGREDYCLDRHIIGCTVRTAREVLREIASCNTDDPVVLRNMAAKALSELYRDEDRRFGRESVLAPVLLVSSSQRRMVEYRRDHPGQKYVFCYSIDHGRGIDTRTPVVMLEPIEGELREFIENRFTSIILYDKM